MSDEEFYQSISYKNGETLKNGQYKILKEIGEGGFGKVYLVEDINSENKK